MVWKPIETLRPNQSAILCYKWKDIPGSPYFVAEGYLSREGIWCDQQGNPTGGEHTAPLYWTDLPKPPLTIDTR